MLKPLTILALATVSLPAQKPGIPATLSYSDQNLISGTFTGLTDQRELLLQSPLFATPAKLKLDNLRSLTLGTIPEKIDTNHYVTATIATHHKNEHQDTLRGQLISIDDNHIILNTPYAGEMTLNRNMVESLDISTSSPSLFTGPGNLADWTFPDNDPKKEGWYAKSGAIISKKNTSIAREITTTDRTHLSATIGWKDGYRFKLLLLADSGKKAEPDYRLDLNIGAGGYLTLRQHDTKNGSIKSLASGSCNPFQTSNPVTFDFYLDRTGNLESALFVNNTFWKSWDLKVPKDQAGHWFHLVPDPQSETKLRLSRITAASWNGKLPDNGPGQDKNQPQRNSDDDHFEQLKGQHIKLRNGDTIVGNIKQITKNHLIITTEYGDINVPVARALNIALTHDQLHQPEMLTGDVRAHFHTGGYVTFTLKDLTTDTITGYSQVFGDVTFKLNAFSRIQFNIWQNKGQPEETFEDLW